MAPLGSRRHSTLSLSTMVFCSLGASSLACTNRGVPAAGAPVPGRGAGFTVPSAVWRASAGARSNGRRVAPSNGVAPTDGYEHRAD